MKRSILLLMLFVFIAFFSLKSLTARKPNLIAIENKKPGTSSFQSPELDRSKLEDELAAKSRASFSAADTGGAKGTRVYSTTTTTSTIAGYADSTSINHGETIGFYVSTNRPSYKIEIYRMGWYDGTGSRLISTVTALAGKNQAVPAPDTTTGLVEARWQKTYSLQTAADWVSGVYLAKLVTDDGKAAYILFVVRADEQPADILYQVPLANYQAYNNWGGKSVYDNSSTNGKRAYKVSFDRPYANGSGAGEFFKGDYNLIRFLESKGYNVTYVSSLDLHRSSTVLENRKVFLSNFHDEYWSGTMRQNLKTAMDRGMHMLFLDSNNIYWQIRFENSSTGIVNRVLVCYKDRNLDPVFATTPSLTTVRWRDTPLNLPENALLGIMYDIGSWFDYGSSFPWIVKNSSHWIYAGTNLQEGQQIAGLVGYEYDHVVNNGQTPANLTVLSESPTVNHDGKTGIAHSSIYTAPSGAIVFSAGTNYWSWKIDDNSRLSKGVDARVQLITQNLLTRMIGEMTPPPPSSTFNAPDALQALPLSSSKIQLTWHDNSTSETEYRIERSPEGTTFAQIVTLPANTTSYINTGRTANTLYYYRVRAYNGSTFTGYSNIASAKTFQVLLAPGNLTALKTASDKITLSWTDNSSDETGFKIQRSTDNVSFKDIKTVGANVTTWTNSTTSGTYYYRVRAYRTVNTTSEFSGYSNTASATF